MKFRIMVLAIGALLLIVSFTGYAAKPKNSNPVEITQLVWDRGTIPAGEGTLENNWWTRYVNQQVGKLGVKVKFIPIPRAQEALKLPTLLAAGEAPDLCITGHVDLLNMYINNSAVHDFTTLYSKYGKHLKKIYSAKDLAVGKLNGKLYSFPTMEMNVSSTTWFRKDWLDKLGLKVPTNLSEFYNTIKAIRDKDPGKVGDKLVPFAIQASADDPFILIDSNVLPGFVKAPPGGEKLVTPYQLWPESREAFRFLNKLYNEKLLGEFILDKDGTRFKQKVIRGEIGCFVAFGHWPYHSAYGGVLENLQKNVPEAKLVSSFPFKAVESKSNLIQFFRNSKYGNRLFSPKTAKHPEAVLKFIDWWASDEGMLGARYGVEGKDFKMIDGIPTPLDEERFKQHVAWIQPQYNTISQLYINNKPKWLKMASMDFPEKYRSEYIKNAYWTGDLKYITPVLTLPTPVRDKYRPTLEKKWNDAKTKIILGSEADFDQNYDAALREYKSGGGDDLAKEAIGNYKATYKK